VPRGAGDCSSTGRPPQSLQGRCPSSAGRGQAGQCRAVGLVAVGPGGHMRGAREQVALVVSASLLIDLPPPHGRTSGVPLRSLQHLGSPGGADRGCPATFPCLCVRTASPYRQGHGEPIGSRSVGVMSYRQPYWTDAPEANTQSPSDGQVQAGDRTAGSGLVVGTTPAYPNAELRMFDQRR